MDYEVLIDKYLRGELTEEERQEFDTRMATDKEFADDVAMMQNLGPVAEDVDDENFRELMAEFEAEAPTSTSSTNLWKNLLVAASIFAVLGLAVYYNLTQPISSSDLYDNYYESYPNVVNPMVRGEEPTEADKAFSAYESGRYEEALQRFEELYKTEGTSYYLFYMAISHLELENAEAAIELLNEFSGTEDKLADRAGWYLAMAYLQLDDKEQAKAALTKVVEEKAYNADKAEELLAELE